MLNKKIKLWLALIIVPFLLIASGFFSTTTEADQAVTVSASISSSVSCTAAPTTADFGTLTTGSIHTASPNVYATSSCNYAAGCTLNVKDNGNGSGSAGLYKSNSPTDLIESATATLSAGTEGYGIQAATSTQGTGAELKLNSVYNKTGINVGGINTTATELASSTAPVALREVISTHKAAISGLTKAGSYSDTITYECVGN